ncbi:MAG: ABC transporter ATP-binding protein [Deltaproteobacteria bacterium]|nr:ABC transporter ATP-binding protein [Deltaproteobacteria bacterium]
MVALEIDNVYVQFGGLQVLSSCSLSIEAGEKRALIGPNGAGKTTLFNVISGMIKPTAGRVLAFQREITASPAHVRASLGLARTFQITNLFINLSVLDNIFLGLQALTPTKYVFYKTTTSFSGLIDQAVALLKKWGLENKKDHLLGSLSHGEQRQLEIILALASQPKILLLDEPTQGLSTAETAMVVPMVRSLDPSTTVLFIEHDMDVAFQMADRITVLNYGTVLAEGTEEEIRSNPKVSEVYLGLDGNEE